MTLQSCNFQHSRLTFLAIVSREDITVVRNSVESQTWDLVVTQSPFQANLSLTARGAAVILLDSSVTGGEWRSMVVHLSRQFPDACIILASTVPDEYLFEEAVKQGAFDVIAIPLCPDELRRAVGLAVAFWNHRRSAPIK